MPRTKKKTKSKFYPRFIEYLNEISHSTYSSEAGLSRALDTSRSNLNIILDFLSIVNADVFCQWIEKLGGKILLPHESVQSDDKELQYLRDKIETLEKLVEAKESIIRLLSKE